MTNYTRAQRMYARIRAGSACDPYEGDDRWLTVLSRYCAMLEGDRERGRQLCTKVIWGVE